MLDSYFTSASLIFSRCATAVITRAVIQENKAKCSLFTYDFLSDDNDNGVTLSSTATNRIAMEPGGTWWNITINVDASTENAEDCGIFTESTSVSKFLTLWKIS